MPNQAPRWSRLLLTVSVGVGVAAGAGVFASCKKQAKPPERSSAPGGEEADAGGPPADRPGVRVVEADGVTMVIQERVGDADLLRRPEGIVPVRAEFACPGAEDFEPTLPDPQPSFAMEDLRRLFPDMPPDKVPVEIDTEAGRISCEVWPQAAPQAAALFLGLATGARAWWHPCRHEWVLGKPYFDETTFQDAEPAAMIGAGCLYRNCEAAAGPVAGIADAGAPFDQPGLMVMPREGRAGTFGILDCQWSAPEPTKVTQGKCEFGEAARRRAAGWVAFGLCRHEGLASAVYRLARVAPDRRLDPRALHWLRAYGPSNEYYRYRPGQGADAGSGPAAGLPAAAAAGAAPSDAPAPAPPPAPPAPPGPAAEAPADAPLPAAALQAGMSNPVPRAPPPLP